mgnify:CR=1 FL=1
MGAEVTEKEDTTIQGHKHACVPAEVAVRAQGSLVLVAEARLVKVLEICEGSGCENACAVIGAYKILRAQSAGQEHGTYDSVLLGEFRGALDSSSATVGDGVSRRAGGESGEHLVAVVLREGLGGGVTAEEKGAEAIDPEHGPAEDKVHDIGVVVLDELGGCCGELGKDGHLCCGLKNFSRRKRRSELSSRHAPAPREDTGRRKREGGKKHKRAKEPKPKGTRRNAAGS